MIGKNSRALQKARRAKHFFLSITPAAFERKLGRGWNIFCAGHDFGNYARPLLEVVRKSENVPFGTICADFWLVGFIFALLLGWVSICLADFTASDSDTLYDIYTRVDAIADDVELMKNRSADWSYIRGHLQEIDDALSPGGGVYLKLASIDGSASSAASRLANIESSSAATASGISSLSDLLDSRLLGISNAIASIPRCNVVLTNLLNAPGNVDMSIVSNLLVSSSSLPYYTIWFPSVAPYFNDFLADYFGTTDLDFDYAKQYYAMSQMGFFNFLLVDALFPSYPNKSSFSFGFDNLLYYSWLTWKEGLQDGTGSTSVNWPYSIFEAYNTLPLGRVTNQLDAIAVTNGGIYRTLQGWNNFDYHAKVAISNTLNAILAKLDGDITINQQLSQSVSTAVAVTNILENALGSSDDVDLDYEEEHDMPRWEPDYQESADENTNEVLYVDATRYLQESMYQGKTNALGNIYSSFDRDPKRLDESLHFGGINPGHGYGYLGGWTMKIGFSESSSAYQELKRICRSVFDTILFVAHLCVFFVFSRRIVKFVTKPFPV